MNKLLIVCILGFLSACDNTQEYTVYPKEIKDLSLVCGIHAKVDKMIGTSYYQAATIDFPAGEVFYIEKVICNDGAVFSYNSDKKLIK